MQRSDRHTSPPPEQEHRGVADAARGGNGGGDPGRNHDFPPRAADEGPGGEIDDVIGRLFGW